MRLREALEWFEGRFCKLEEMIMSGFDDLNAAVTATQTAVTAAITDIASLSAQIKALNAGTVTDAQLEAIAKQLNTTSASLQAAVTPPAP